MSMTPALQDRILSRLTESGAADKPWALVLLAALEDDATLNGYLAGDVSIPPVSAPEESGDAAHVEPPGIFLSSITVSGFRGIGPGATLPLRPGPGLTLVVGRNGSGKSSFAEALEFLLTGKNYRWEKRPAAWQEGWMNLHDNSACSLKAELIVEGKGPLVVTRKWTGPALDDGETVVAARGESARPFASLGWGEALATFRPFLSYNELGSLLEEGPSKLYDALSGVLGLDDLVDVQARLATARRTLKQCVDDARRAGKTLSERLQSDSASDDDRIDAALRELRGGKWNLDALEQLVTGGGVSSDSGLGVLQRIGELVPPDMDAIARAIDRLRETEAACARLAGTDAERARRRADLLSAALEFQPNGSSRDCPVCGTEDVAGEDWRQAAEQEVAALTKEAGDLKAAGEARDAAIREAQQLLMPAPSVLGAAAAVGLTTLEEVVRVWGVWATGRALTTATDLASHLENHAVALVDAVSAVVAEAKAEVARREDRWRPIASAIAEWLPMARRGVQARAHLDEVVEAEAWWKDTVESIRDERFAPIADRAMKTWQLLRLQSNVDLADVQLEGTSQRRKVKLRVTVDGTPAEAVGVMSQGELHALALSLFLPRATLPESPFRFIAIDDPVQSMDPARVDGLARVLADAATSRQVIVFTHDDRLPEAIRRLRLPATVVSVTRRGKSVVEVSPAADPVQGYLDDARAVMKTTGLPDDVVKRVVPGFCRSALEAACMETVRRRLLGRGETYADVERVLTENANTHPLMALALFKEQAPSGDVFKRLNNGLGAWAGDAFRACKEGAHGAFHGDLDRLVRDTDAIAKFVRQQA